jgi:hypothetical protein
MKQSLLIIAVSLAVLCGCASKPDTTYLSQIQSIEEAYQNKDLTKAEYLKLKMDAENASAQRRAMESQRRATIYQATQSN